MGNDFGETCELGADVQEFTKEHFKPQHIHIKLTTNVQVKKVINSPMLYQNPRIALKA